LREWNRAFILKDLSGVSPELGQSDTHGANRDRERIEMKTQLTQYVAWLPLTLLLAGCGEEVADTAYHDAQLGIHFDFPGGWRRLDPSELPPGKESLVTIEDSSGVASVSLVEFDLQAVLGTLDTQLMLQVAGEDDVQRGLALFVQLNSTFDEVFQQRYDRYQLLDREWVRKYGDQPAVASDLVFEGHLPDEPMLMWRKASIILVAGQYQKGFIMAYAVPSLLIDDYRDAFDFVEMSWRTID
jgi:hypothetical protein